MRISWTREEVDARLYKIMKNIHEVCHRTAEKYGTPGNYVNGANIAGFLKVANAMMDQVGLALSFRRISGAVAVRFVAAPNDPILPDRAPRLQLILVNPRHLPRRARPGERLAILPLRSAMAAAVGLVAFVEFLQNLSNHWRGQRIHHAPSLPRRPRKEQQTRTAAFPRGHNRQTRLRFAPCFSAPTGRCRFCPPPLRSPGWRLRCSGGSIDRINHSRPKLRHRFAGKIERLFLAYIISCNDPAID